ncbi:MAG: phosphatase PAP2 family protein [Rhodanobacter sp.]
MLVALAATVAFAVVAFAVASHADITRSDVQFAQWLHAHRWPVLIGAMRVVSWMNGVVGVCVMATALALWFWRVRARAWFELVLLAIPGVILLNHLLKQCFARPRPHLVAPWTSLTSYSFPSGHVSQSTVFYGLLATWLCLRCGHLTTRVLIVVAAWLMIVTVAASRVYLGAHYLTDVVAALFEGVGWLAVCHLALAWRQPGDGFVREGA